MPHAGSHRPLGRQLGPVLPRWTLSALTSPSHKQRGVTHPYLPDKRGHVILPALSLVTGVQPSWSGAYKELSLAGKCYIAQILGGKKIIMVFVVFIRCSEKA